MGNKKIIFVDDEPNILQGLRRSLRSMRHEWDMTFAKSGTEALQLLENQPFDVIVSDMRMPGMDGLQLLTRVMKTYPDVVRIALSGQTSEEQILRSVKAVHQYLSKPCEVEKLKQTINQTFQLRELLNNEAVTRLVSQMESLPSVPSIYNEIIKELQSEQSSLKSIGKIIARDVGMTAMILKIVNSAFFGFFGKISDPGHAVSLLGLETIKALVLSHQFFEVRAIKGVPASFISRLLSHSLQTAVIAKQIAKDKKLAKNETEDIFTIGVLHDVGKVILAAQLGEAYAQIISESATGNQPLWQVELKKLGTTHAEIGAYLLGIWGLPVTTIEAIAYHHRLTEEMKASLTLPSLLACANMLEHEISPAGNELSHSGKDTSFLQQIGCLEEYPGWKTKFENQLTEGAGK